MQWNRFGTLPREVYEMTEGEVMALTAFFSLSQEKN
jgi:hypothetical protein